MISKTVTFFIILSLLFRIAFINQIYVSSHYVILFLLPLKSNQHKKGLQIDNLLKAKKENNLIFRGLQTYTKLDTKGIL